jgi:hypothetical protein
MFKLSWFKFQTSLTLAYESRRYSSILILFVFWYSKGQKVSETDRVSEKFPSFEFRTTGSIQTPGNPESSLFAFE